MIIGVPREIYPGTGITANDCQQVANAITATEMHALHVATTGNDANDCLSTMRPCRTIAAAVTKAAAGDPIAIAPGTGSVYVAWRQFRVATVNCVREKGFWKDQSSSWPVASLVVGGRSYTRQQALAILQKSVPPSESFSVFDASIRCAM